MSKKSNLELQIKYLSNDIEEVKRTINEYELKLHTYRSVLKQLEADMKFYKSKSNLSQ